jgi:hypothetical protein
MDRINQVKSHLKFTSKISYLLIISILISILGLSCEKTKIYAEKQDDLIQIDTLALQLCQSDDDCPQWACVKSTCEVYDQPYSAYDKQKVCVPKRSPMKIQSLASAQKTAIAAVDDFDLSLDQKEIYILDSDKKQFRIYQKNNGNEWKKQDEFENTDEIQQIFAGPDRSIFYGIEDRLIRTDIESRLSKSYQLANQVAHVWVDLDGLWWASIGAKGIELVNPENIENRESNDPIEANPRFETAGRALKSKSSNAYLLVADQFAGLSAFLKRSRGGLESGVGARSLQTPPQEVSTQGQLIDLDINGSRVITAEYGAGVGVLELSAQGGLIKNHQLSFDTLIKAVVLIDPFTAVVQSSDQKLLLIDLLTIDNLNANQKQLSFDGSFGVLAENPYPVILKELFSGDQSQISKIKWGDSHLYWLADRKLFELEMICQ